MSVPCHTPRRALGYLTLLALIPLGSCATLRYGADSGMVRKLDAYLSQGRGDEIARMTQLPFLLDGEVVLLSQDVRDFWDGVVHAGWRLAGWVVAEGTPVGQDTWKMFAQTQEVRSFFHNYVGKRARLLELTDERGGRALLLVQERAFSWRILGLATSTHGGGAS